MENQINNLDDLLFVNRNRSYGAYSNRKNYGRYMFWALMAGVFIFCTIISVPLIANYFGGVMGGEKEVIVIADTLQKIVEKPDLPEIKEVEKTKPEYKPYVAPVVVSTDADDIDLMAFLDNLKNRNVLDTSTQGPVDIEDFDVKPPIIEVEKTDWLLVEEMPVFPGGDEGRLRYLAANVKYPEAARAAGLEGPVHVSFVVNEFGHVVDVSLLRGIGGGCDEEALRAIRNMPDWKPGRQSGKAVRVKFSMAVHFKLETR